MRILFFSRLFDPHIGGVEKHVANLSQELIKKKHQITIITEGYQSDLPITETSHGIKIFRMPTYNLEEKNKKWLIWRWLWQNKTLLKDADIIHIHDVFYWWLPFKLIFPFKKVFITYHGYEGNQPPAVSAIIQRKLGEWLSAGTICVGDFMRTWYFAKPNLVIYGATTLNAFKPVPQFKPQFFPIVYLGRLSQDAGIMTYLQALKIVNKQDLKIKLDVFGDGPQLAQAKQFVQENQLNVTFKGAVKNASQFLPKYKIAFVSRYLAMLEAMQAQVSVIAVFNNQIKQDYLTCHPQAKNITITNQPAIIAKTIMQIIQNKKTNKVKLASAHDWAQNQTWQNLSNQYLELWQ